MRLNIKNIVKYVERGLLLSAVLALLIFISGWINADNGVEKANAFLLQRAGTTLDTNSNSGKIYKPETPNSQTRKTDFLSGQSSAKPRALVVDKPDTSDWSNTRKQEFISRYSHTDSEKQLNTVMAVINIPSVGVKAPIFKGTSHQTLSQGAGLITGTSALQNPRGNVGVAAHRDSFFRGLKDIEVGDEIVVSTTTHDLLYTVTGMSIVQPNYVSVLYPDEKRKLTLVTCYPFYFTGKAPHRFIVTAIFTNARPI